MLADKVIFITGGGSGLGAVLVKECIKSSAKVFFTYRTYREAAKELDGEERLGCCQADASVYEQAVQSVMECMKTFGRIDVLINNAASARDAALLKSNVEDFDYTIKNVLYPVYHYSKAVSSIMADQGSGTIINIGSINGIRGREGSVGYSTAKAGVIGMTKTMAKELGRFGITCNVVAPGYIDTDGQKNTSELIKKLVLDECAIRKLSTPADIANLVLFLASDRAENITGQVYQIDCGQYI